MQSAYVQPACPLVGRVATLRKLGDLAVQIRARTYLYTA